MEEEDLRTYGWIIDDPLTTNITSLPDLSAFPMELQTGAATILPDHSLPTLPSTFHHVFHYIEIISLALVIFAGIVSNAIVFLLFYRKPTMRNFSNRFVLNLSFSHLLQCLLVLPTMVLSAVARGWILGEITCLTTGVLSTALDIASVLSLLLIALDRNCAVNSPLHYSMTITKKRTGALITCTWALSFLMAIPPLFGITTIGYQHPWHTCKLRWLSGDPYSITYATILFAIGFAVPFLTTSCVYCSMFQAARNNTERARKHSLNNSIPAESTLPDITAKPLSMYTPRKKCRRWSSGSSQASLFGDEWKAVRTGLLVVITFTLCWLPHFSMMVLRAFSTVDHLIPHYALFLVSLCSSSACVINPYLYVFRNKTARKNIRKLLSCMNLRKNRSWLLRSGERRKHPQNLTSPCILTANLVSNTSEKVKALPVLFQDTGEQWRVLGTAEEKNRGDELDENASNASDDCFEREALEYGIQRIKQTAHTVNVHAIYNSDALNRCHPPICAPNNPLSMSSSRFLIFRLRSQAFRDSISSDTTENCSISFDSVTGYDEVDSHVHAMRRTVAKSHVTSDDCDHRVSNLLRTVSSFTEEEPSSESCQKHISYFGSTRRKSFIHSHIRNRKSSETTLTSSANSETQEVSLATTSQDDSSAGIRPKLTRQDTTVLPGFESQEETA